ncbi:MAG TPA: trypsin-like serine protease, partial [Streptosporangiaceae bacterium]|nr:trypsin-like serine protease [Streptosporangiaceae bacterium]
MSSHRKPVLRLPASKRAVIAAAAVVAVGAAGAVAVGSALAGTSAAPAGARSGAAVGDVYRVPAAAQAAARAFWTPSRMAVTVTPPVPQSAMTGPGRPGLRFAPAVSAQSIRRGSKGAPAGTPNSWSFGGVSTVGALFYTTGSGKHFCTASVIHTAAGTIVLTAAHCVYTNSFAQNLEFVPAYSNGRQPYGIWTVTQITV